jgi:PAS domain S-box-containing protein
MEFELAPMPMFLLLPDGRLLQANLAMRELFGWQGDDHIGVDVHDLVDAEDRGVIADRLRTVLASDAATEEVTTVITGADGRRHRARSSSLTVRDDSGVPRYIIARILPAGE